MTPVELVAAGVCAFVLIGLLEFAILVAIAKMRRRW